MGPPRKKWGLKNLGKEKKFLNWRKDQGRFNQRGLFGKRSLKPGNPNKISLKPFGPPFTLLQIMFVIQVNLT